jgi:hypothetical protein
LSAFAWATGKRFENELISLMWQDPLSTGARCSTCVGLFEGRMRLNSYNEWWDPDPPPSGHRTSVFDDLQTVSTRQRQYLSDDRLLKNLKNRRASRRNDKWIL